MNVRCVTNAERFSINNISAVTSPLVGVGIFSGARSIDYGTNNKTIASPGLMCSLDANFIARASDLLQWSTKVMNNRDGSAA